MKIKKILHKNVLPNGTFSDQSGAVETRGTVRMSKNDMDDGYWMTIIQPRTEDGIVEGIQVVFDDRTEMDIFLKQRCING